MKDASKLDFGCSRATRKLTSLYLHIFKKQLAMSIINVSFPSSLPNWSSATILTVTLLPSWITGYCTTNLMACISDTVISTEKFRKQHFLLPTIYCVCPTRIFCLNNRSTWGNGMNLKYLKVLIVQEYLRSV